MDYQQRSNLNLIGFGIRYVLLKEFVKKAERAADSFAVSRGMSEYILKTKRFILNHSQIDETYKTRIKQYYLSPDEIMEMVKEQDSIKDNFLWLLGYKILPFLKAILPHYPFHFYLTALFLVCPVPIGEHLLGHKIHFYTFQSFASGHFIVFIGFF